VTGPVRGSATRDRATRREAAPDAPLARPDDRRPRPRGIRQRCAPGARQRWAASAASTTAGSPRWWRRRTVRARPRRERLAPSGDDRSNGLPRAPWPSGRYFLCQPCRSPSVSPTFEVRFEPPLRTEVRNVTESGRLVTPRTVFLYFTRKISSATLQFPHRLWRQVTKGDRSRTEKGRGSRQVHPRSPVHPPRTTAWRSRFSPACVS
jgi:hypothetical protein